MDDAHALHFEERVLKEPYSVPLWLDYLRAAAGSSAEKALMLMRRATTLLPGSYKLWRVCLEVLVQRHRDGDVAIGEEVVCETYERALVFLYKMPRIWLDYCAFLAGSGHITRVRKVYDRALRILPVTQHDRVWEHALEFARESGCEATQVNFFRRFLEFDPSRREDFVEFFLSEEVNKPAEAALELAKIVKNVRFVSLQGKTRVQLYLQLCDLLCKHPEDIARHPVARSSLSVELIMRAGIREFRDESGKLWLSLADYYIRSGEFERVRDIYEEALDSVTSVRDFSLIFNAYSQFEEAMISAKLEVSSSEEADDENDDIDLRLMHLENLLQRNKILLSSVRLRQDPNDVSEWLKRSQLFLKTLNDPEMAIQVYSEAVKTVKPEKISGTVQLSSLWTEFAKFYESLGDIESARFVFEKAKNVPYASWKELSIVICESIELELRKGNYNEALEKIRSVLKPPDTNREHVEAEALNRQLRAKGLSNSAAANTSTKSQLPYIRQRILRSGKLWALRLDLEESLSTLESTRLAYDETFALKIVTPQIILNYASLLIERQYFEDAFSIYERGLVLFQWDTGARDIYLAYLREFTNRYPGSTKIERTRELFEQAIHCAGSYFQDGVLDGNKQPGTKKQSKAVVDVSLKPVFLMYAQVEERGSLASRAMAIYERACQQVLESEKYEMFLLAVRKAKEHFGVSKAREIYQTAIETLKDDLQVKDMCLKFAELEKSLGEIARARSLYQYASQFCDPQVATTFWNEWRDFEIAHGNEDTFRDMLRVSRTVRNEFASRGMDVVSLAKEAAELKAQGSSKTTDSLAPPTSTFSSASSSAIPEISTDTGTTITQKKLPAFLSGASSSKRQATDDSNDEQQGADRIGALDRIKRAKKG